MEIWPKETSLNKQTIKLILKATYFGEFAEERGTGGEEGDKDKKGRKKMKKNPNL